MKNLKNNLTKNLEPLVRQFYLELENYSKESNPREQECKQYLQNISEILNQFSNNISELDTDKIKDLYKNISTSLKGFCIQNDILQRLRFQITSNLEKFSELYL